MIKKCLLCGKKFKTFPCRIGKYCSYICSAKGTLNSPFIKGHKDFGTSESHKRQGKKMRQYCGKKCWNWKGDNISIRMKHHRIQKIKGSPKICSQCGKKAIHWANIDHRYSLNPNDYIPLCMSCHMKYDFKMGFRIIS